MNKSYPFTEIQGKLSLGQKILIALPASPKYDQVAAALALSLSLQQTDKTVNVVSPTAMTVEFHNLVGVDKVGQKASGTDLVVSLNYQMDNVEKISYNDDGGKLNLVIQPKPGAPALSEKTAGFSFAGAGADLVFTIGIKNINQLSVVGLGSVNPETIINIDNRPDNNNFAAVNVIDVDSSSVSEMIFGLLSGLGFSPDIDVAQNLLSGVWQATDGLRKADINPDTYELVAGCLRLGAQKPTETPQPQKVWQVKEEKKIGESVSQPRNPPPDWLEPKIFRGTSNN